MLAGRRIAPDHTSGNLPLNKSASLMLALMVAASLLVTLFARSLHPPYVDVEELILRGCTKTAVCGSYIELSCPLPKRHDPSILFIKMPDETLIWRCGARVCTDPLDPSSARFGPPPEWTACTKSTSEK
jgi:hypothetical protein